MNKVIKNIESNSKIKVVFTDLFDTLIHRTVHPYFVYKLWAKLLIRELGMVISIDELYRIRISAINTLAKDLGCNKVEIPYDILIQEIFHRLSNSNRIDDIAMEKFHMYFREADYQAEIPVQFKNQELVEGLRYLKEKNYKLFIVSDFHLPATLIKRLLEYHGILDLFNDVFSSCDHSKSKESGDLYQFLLTETNSKASETSMMGDNKKSDFINASKNGLYAQYLKHYSHKIRNKKNLLGSSEKDFIETCKKTEKVCKKSEHPFSEYIIHFYFFTERLYEQCKKKGIKDLFFLAREGHYLKELFDKYQHSNILIKEDKIKTHYLRASRHSATQVSLKPIEEEEFLPVKKKYDNQSTRNFLSAYRIEGEVANEILSQIGVNPDEVILDFASSNVLIDLRKNTLFKDQYEANRTYQKKAFDAYLDSFNVNFTNDGLNLVDVGWGGTMQEKIHQYLDRKIDVTGYYIGLKEIYTIENKTKRFGLNFSVYPKIDYTDHILMANGQLYEQLLAASHGSTLGYSLSDEAPTLEFHEENEKKVFDNYILPIQNFMNTQFDVLNSNLKSCYYSSNMVQNFMTDMALRSGILTRKKELKFIQDISQGFYQNVGNNQVGIAYDPNELSLSKKALLKEFLWTPEKTFRYLVKIKPLLFSKKLSWLGWTVNLTYYYIHINRAFKNKLFSKKLV